VAIKNLKRYKLLGIDQIPAEMIQAGNQGYILSNMNLLILFAIGTNCINI
jgi:hypothetical protein